MARIRDVAPVIQQIGMFGLVKRVFLQLGEDSVFTWGAALAYSWMFAIFPFLIFLLSLVPLVPAQIKPNVFEDIHKLVRETLPDDAASLIMTQVKNVLDKPSAGGFLSFGLLLTTWASSGGMSMTISALDKAYDIDKGRNFLRQRLVAIVLTIVVATMVILVMVLMPIASLVLAWLSHQGTIFGWIIFLVDLARYAIAMLLMFCILAVIYSFGPSKRMGIYFITPGSLFCVTVWLLLGAAFKIYLTRFGGAASYNKTYGAVAGAAILLLFFYIDALVLLIGAEINSEIDFAKMERARALETDPTSAPT